MATMIQQLECVVIQSLRRFKDRYFPDEVFPDMPTEDPEHREKALLDCLPVDVQFLIMTFLSPADICHLGATSLYWRAMVRDPLLWRYFLWRDMPYWPSIDNVTMPRLEMLDSPISRNDEIPDDMEEGEDERMGPKFDYMSEYLKGCPSCRQQWLPSRPAYEVVTSFLQSLVTLPEPRYAMFGPGMEQLDVSFVTRLMHTPDVLPVSGTPRRQINGIGSGISYVFNNQHKFNILTLYSTNRAERERAREQQVSVSNKLFVTERANDSGCLVYRPTPQVQQVCHLVDGFIYVANAESDHGDKECEEAQIQAVLNCAESSTSKPLLVLSCVSREQPQAISQQNRANEGSARSRTPCVVMAKRLGLPKITNRWMVQDTVAESLSGLLDGISWLLKCSGVKICES